MGPQLLDLMRDSGSHCCRSRCAPPTAALTAPTVARRPCIPHSWCSPACTADVVALQEVWVAADAALLRQAAAEGALPHSHLFSSGAIGSGLLLLSRWPITAVAFHTFSTRGDPAAVLNGDWFAGKGA